MIRLLAHLLIMLSFGLIYNVNAEASNYKKLDLIFCENDSSRYTGVYIRENVNGKCPNSGYETTDKSRNSYFNVSHLCYVHNNPKRYKVISHESKNCKSIGATKINYNSIRNEYYTYVKIAKKETRKIISSETITEVARYKGYDSFGDGACVEAKSGAIKIALANASEKYGVTFTGDNIINTKVLSRYPVGVSCEIQVEVSLIKYNYEEINSSSENIAKIEEEKRKIEEEKRKIEEEKRKIAEAKKKQEEEERKRKEEDSKLYVIGSGTGFFVSAEGHIVSNDHVVGICRKVATKIEGETKYFNILKTDEVNDLGIIKGDYKSPNFLSIKADGAEYGEDIVAFGYPLADALSTSVKLTRGIVSSLSGPGNNYSEIQIDAAIQPGNSGGPILNMEGQVVGVASSGLNKLYMLEKAEYIPENVNFAVASPTLSNFLKANGVPISNKSYDVKNTKELAKIGRPSTLQLFCMNTKAVFEELKKKKKHSDVLFEKVIELR